MIVSIGVHPPPSSGAPAVTAALLEALRCRGTQVMSIDLSAWGRLEQTPVNRFLRLLRVIAGVCRMTGVALGGGTAGAYIALSGGLGRYYDVLFAAIARAVGMRLVLHHHSSGCLQALGASTALLCRVAGRGAVHVVQCETLAQALAANYGVPGPLIISNAFAVPASPRSDRARKRPLTIGYLGNMVESKGILEFLDVAAAIGRSMPAARALIAGPLQERSLAGRFQAALRSAPAAEYVGPVTDADKTAFFRSVDVLLFPSRYFHEAEPLTILEALSHGVPVIAIERGCIGELLRDAGGMLVPEGASFVAAALAALGEWHLRPAEWELRSEAARARFTELRQQAVRDLDVVLEVLT